MRNHYTLSQSQLINTVEFAALNQVKPETVRARICRTGHYFGIKPVKLANNRLAFPPELATAKQG